MINQFCYDDHRGHHIITLKRAAPEWCNSDCPVIYVVSDDRNLHGFKLHTSLTMEAIPNDLARLFTSFVWRSSQAYYRKREGVEVPVTENGFWKNFLYYNTRLFGENYMYNLVISAGAKWIIR